MKKANKKKISELAKKIRPIKDDLKMYSGGKKGMLDATLECWEGPGSCDVRKY